MEKSLDEIGWGGGEATWAHKAFWRLYESVTACKFEFQLG